MPRESKHYDDDIPMPDDIESEGDGDEYVSNGKSATATEQSPLDTEAPRKTQTQPKPKNKRKVKEYEEDVPEKGRDAEDDREAPSLYEDESPLDADAEAALQMAEVERVGPGEGPGWYGRLFDYGDGRGPQPVSYGRVGSLPSTRDIYERTGNLTGGGQYKFVRKGKPPVFKILPGPPKPLPTEQEQQAQQVPFFGHSPGYSRFPSEGVRFEEAPAPADPFGEAFDPTQGVDPEVFTQSGLNGWFRGGPYNRLIYYVNGVPSRPPRGSRPPAALLNPAAAGGAPDFGPEDFYHREDKDKEKKEEPTVKLLEKLIEKLDQPKVDPMAGLANMMKIQMDQDRLRWEQERDERQRREDRERAEADRKWEAEKLRQENEFKLLMARLDKESAAVASKKDNEVEIARINADATKEAAKQAAISAEKMAQMQSDANKQIVDIVIKKSANENPMNLFEKGVKMALDFAGGKEDNAATQIAEAVERAAPSVAGAVRDSVLAIKGYPVQSGQPGAPALQGPAGSPPALPGPGAPGPGNQAPPSSGGIPTAQETVANLQLAAYFAEAIRLDLPPSSDLLVSGCLAYGLVNNYKVIRNQILMATPEIIAAKFEEGARAVQIPVFVNNIENVKALALSEKGRNWLAQFKANIQKRMQKEVQAEQAEAQARAAKAQAAQGQAPQTPPTQGQS